MSTQDMTDTTADAQPKTDAPADDGDRLEEVTTVAKEAQRKADLAFERVLELREENQTLAERVEGLEAERDELRAELQQVRQRTDLLEALREADALTPEERAAMCIQTLYNEACREIQKDTADAATASMDYNKCEGVFHGQITRDKIYRTFDTAEELVGDRNVVKVIEEDRSSAKNTRLALSLEDGDVPPVIAGHEIEEPGV